MRTRDASTGCSRWRQAVELPGSHGRRSGAGSIDGVVGASSRRGCTGSSASRTGRLASARPWPTLVAITVPRAGMSAARAPRRSCRRPPGRGRRDRTAHVPRRAPVAVAHHRRSPRCDVTMVDGIPATTRDPYAHRPRRDCADAASSRTCSTPRSCNDSYGRPSAERAAELWAPRRNGCARSSSSLLDERASGACASPRTSGRRRCCARCDALGLPARTCQPSGARRRTRALPRPGVAGSEGRGGVRRLRAALDRGASSTTTARVRTTSSPTAGRSSGSRQTMLDGDPDRVPSRRSRPRSPAKGATCSTETDRYLSAKCGVGGCWLR